MASMHISGVAQNELYEVLIRSDVFIFGVAKHVMSFKHVVNFNKFVYTNKICFRLY